MRTDVKRREIWEWSDHTLGDTFKAKVLASAFGLAVDIERSLIAARTAFR